MALADPSGPENKYMTNQSHVFHRHTHMDPPIADRGDGCYLIDTSGKRYLDASGGGRRSRASVTAMPR